MNIESLFSILLCQKIESVPKILCLSKYCNILNTKYLWKLLYARDYVSKNVTDYYTTYIIIKKLDEVDILSFDDIPFVCKFSQIIQKHYDINNLFSLTIWGSGFDCLPMQISKLVCLKELHLYSCVLCSLPSEICGLINLETLYLMSGRMQCLPIELNKLQNLKMLNISYHCFNIFPSVIYDLVALDTLIMYDNRIVSIGPEISGLTNLTHLDLGCNRLSFIPDELYDMDKLSVLCINTSLGFS